jgi:hypothetical protein
MQTPKPFTRKYLHERTSKSKGQGMIEFGMTASILLILFSGMVDLGRAYISLLSLRDATQEGAVYGSIAPSDVSGIKQRTLDTLDYPIELGEITEDQITVEILGSSCAEGVVKVSISYEFQFVTPFIYGETIILSADARDTILTPPC